MNSPAHLPTSVHKDANGPAHTIRDADGNEHPDLGPVLGALAHGVDFTLAHDGTDGLVVRLVWDGDRPVRDGGSRGPVRGALARPRPGAPAPGGAGGGTTTPTGLSA